MANEKKISYTKVAFGYLNAVNTEDPLNGCFGMVEGFVRDLKTRTVQTSHGEQAVADLRISVVLPDNRVKQMFGESLVDNIYHSVTFRVSYWGMAARQLAEHAPAKGQKMLCLIKGMKVNVYDNGENTYRTVDATGLGFPFRNSKAPEGNESANSGSDRGISYPAPSAVPAANGPDSYGFTEVNDEEFELPF